MGLSASSRVPPQNCQPLTLSFSSPKHPPSTQALVAATRLRALCFTPHLSRLLYVPYSQRPAKGRFWAFVYWIGPRPPSYRGAVPWCTEQYGPPSLLQTTVCCIPSDTVVTCFNPLLGLSSLLCARHDKLCWKHRSFLFPLGSHQSSSILCLETAIMSANAVRCPIPASLLDTTPYCIPYLSYSFLFL